MSIIVTGAAGFIGCNNTIALNKRGYTDILAVDNLTKADKFLNLSECQISDYMDKHDFIDLVRQGKMPRPEAVFHQGACSDTMATDGRYVMDNNYRYTLELYHWCQREKVPFIYASSAATYGASTTFVEDVKYEGPLNCYGYSKYLFDQVLRRDMARGAVVSPVTGFRYFNVYGPHEQHKGRMASVAFHQYFQFRKEGKVKLFEGCLGYSNGEQRRDFVYVGDVIDTILGFFDHPVTGIFNLGTGVGYSVLDMVNTFSRVNNVKVPYVIAPRRAGDIAACYADSAKAGKVLGWHAELGLEDMVRDSWNWQSHNPNGYDD